MISEGSAGLASKQVRFEERDDHDVAHLPQSCSDGCCKGNRPNIADRKRLKRVEVKTRREKAHLASQA